MEESEWGLGDAGLVGWVLGTEAAERLVGLVARVEVWRRMRCRGWRCGSS
uniref:Uncharacterized protein n=1 Tax=Arundo donax TaxID=35708 RepID=A0A0A9FNC5_ARUDO